MADSPARPAPAEIVMAASVPVIWGLNFIFIKDALPWFASPQVFNAVRWIVAMGVLLMLVTLRRDPLWIARRDWGRLAVIACVGNVVQQLTFINGIRLTTAGHSALIMGLSPVMVALASEALRIERVDRRTWAGIALSVLGLALLVRPGAANTPPTAFLGDLLTLASAASWAVYTVASRPLTMRYPPASVTVAAAGVATVILIALSVPDARGQPWAEVPLRAWGSLVYSGALGVCPRNALERIRMHVSSPMCIEWRGIFMFAHSHAPFSISRTHS